MRKLVAALLLLVPCGALVLAGPPLLGHALFAFGFEKLGAALMRDAGWRGYALARDGDYRAAAASFGSGPANSYNRGVALTKAGLYAQALDAYDDALQADPEDEDARHNKAIVEQILDTAAQAAGDAAGNANARANKERRHGGSGDQNGDTASTGIGYTGNKEGSTNASTQGGSKVAKIGKGQQAASGDNSEKASGSAGQASGRGRSGGDMADAITAQLAINQRKYSPTFTQLNVQPTVEWLQTVTDNPGSYLKLQIRAEQKRRREQADREAGAGGDD